MTQRVIVRAGVGIHPVSSCSRWCRHQMIHHPASSGSQAWVLSPEWANQCRHPPFRHRLRSLPPTLRAGTCNGGGGGVTPVPPVVVVSPPAIHPTSSCS